MSDQSQSTWGRVIGVVEGVTSRSIEILLDIDAPQSTALNSGAPQAFPVVNGFLLVPAHTGAIVGLISSISIERSAYPKRIGPRDFGLVDLPYPLRKLSLVPIGFMTVEPSTSSSAPSYQLERGISSLPTVGDPAVIPTDEQLRSLIESPNENRRVPIGTAPIAAGATVSVDPDRLFGRHLAVLGNTGSGKSCTVAGLIRWSLDAATERLDTEAKSPNARFIILDPNGEYSAAFKDGKHRTRVFTMPDLVTGDVEGLQVPAWLWNSSEWSSFAAASSRVQRPILIEALKSMKRSEGLADVPVEHLVSDELIGYGRDIEDAKSSHGPGFRQGQGMYRMHETINLLAIDCDKSVEKLSGDKAEAVSNIGVTAREIIARRTNDRGYPQGFAASDLEEITDAINQCVDNLGTHSLELARAPEDAPIQFDVGELPDRIDQIAFRSPVSNAAQFVATLSMRVRMLVSDSQLADVIGNSSSITLEQWLNNYVGSEEENNAPVSIIDLSLVPSDVIHVVTAVIARLVFEALQRYRRKNDKVLPTVLVLEEAHTFVSRERDATSDDGILTPSAMCRRTFERIAREGRKFGLGLVLASQRPSELSPTVLSQCNTFLLHRIVNDRDQELVGRLVPDNLRGLMDDLPSLPTRQAILVGWASPIPIITEINHLADGQRPKSDDPDFWDVWTHKKPRPVDWGEISSDWQT